MARPSTAEKRKVFRKLHDSGCFVIPNPWNVGSARYLQGLGFKALATTSSGYAHSQGYADGALSADAVLAHFHELAAGIGGPQRLFLAMDVVRDQPVGRSQDFRRAAEVVFQSDQLRVLKIALEAKRSAQ